jgi:adenylylsulfate kinase-like enzyme
MVIFMAGHPFSGKSFIVSMIKEALGTIGIVPMVIDPKTFRDSNYDILDEDSKRDMNLAAWEVSQEVLDEYVVDNMNDIIIYDTACASYQRMEPHFKHARDHNHKILYVMVTASLDVCKKRAGKNWLSEEVLKKYDVSFSVYTDQFSGLADKTVFIKNDFDRPPNINKVIEAVMECQ